MFSTAGLLSLPLMVICGWFVSYYEPDVARKVARAFSIVLAVLLACVVVSGWNHRGLSGTHTWLGFAMPRAAWLFAPFALGVLFQQQNDIRFLRFLSRAFLLVFILGVILLASMTGYMGPSHDPEISVETSNRFHVMHQFILPSLTMILSIASYRSFPPPLQQRPPETP